MHPDGPEAQVVRGYPRLDLRASLDGLLGRLNSTCRNAQAILDEDHAYLDKIKERILEYLGVRKLRPDSRGPILCFVGPPGVGKTSLGRSIARAMGREFVRISLGGVRDEAEVRGHRRTYVGALSRAASSRACARRAPTTRCSCWTRSTSSARIFAATPHRRCSRCSIPEQNEKFSDHYLNTPFDLSKVFFITTANMLDTIPGPLRDRMEVIRLPGYTPEEKIEIARSFQIPRQMEEHGLPERTGALVAGGGGRHRDALHAGSGGAKPRAPDRDRVPQGCAPQRRG